MIMDGIHIKIFGSLLIFAGGVGAYLLWRRASVTPLRIGRALWEDLAILRYQICMRRAALPEILSSLCGGEGAVWLWGPLAERLGGESDIRRCWSESVAALPPPLGRILEPLGPLLSAGGTPLAAAIAEAREELAGFLRAEEPRRASQGRIAAALCLSVASLLILALV